MTERNLFDLLPAVYRLHDRAQGDPLRALLAVIEHEVGRVEENIEQLYDDWFIETCSEWVVPYVGDLLGVRHLLEVDGGAFSQRAYVANTIGYRRRKGTAGVLEQLANDITGWPACAVEFFEHLVTTQHVNHPRPGAPATTDVRSAQGMEAVGTPFETATHLAEVRNIDRRRGRYSIPNLGLFLWRLQSYPLDEVTSRPVDPKRFTFDPLGNSNALFSVPETESGQPITAANVPMALSRLRLEHERQRYYGNADDPSSLVVRVDGVVVPSTDIVVANLSDVSGGWAHEAPAGKTAIDPQLGRIAFGDAPTGVVSTSYAYAFAGDLGGGPYDKRGALASYLENTTWQMGVMAAPPPNEPRIKSTLTDVVKEWNKQAAGTQGVIVLMESRTITDDLSEEATRIAIPERSRLVIVSGHWPEEDTDDPLDPLARLTGRVAAQSVRAHLHGPVHVIGTAPPNSQPGSLVLMGLLIDGALTVKSGNLGALVITHSTLVPGGGGLTFEANDDLALSFDHSIAGDVQPGDNASSAAFNACIVDGNTKGRDLSVESSTFFGPVAARTLHASSSIFAGRVDIERRQVGCVRFSYVSEDSLTPRRFRCHPDHHTTEVVAVPTFASWTYGDPRYATLSSDCAVQISDGAEGETEMGAWRFLQSPKRLRNLRSALDEYLRFGLQAGMFFVPQQTAASAP